jgi:hypothetical protein
MRFAKYVGSTALAVLVLAMPAHAQSNANLDQLMALVIGEYSNLPQVEAAKAQSKPGAQLPEPLRDVHHMYATRVDMPKLGTHVAYIEWRHNGPTGVISGQRIWAYDAQPDGILMRFHTLKPSAKAVLSGLIQPAAKTRQIGPDDVNAYPAPCYMLLKPEGAGFAGTNLPLGGCTFPRTTGTAGTMMVDATLRFFPDYHGEKTDILMLGLGESAAGRTPEVEDWVYQRIR